MNESDRASLSLIVIFLTAYCIFLHIKVSDIERTLKETVSVISKISMNEKRMVDLHETNEMRDTILYEMLKTNNLNERLVLETRKLFKECVYGF
jgi:uncharacterized protein YoxC